MPRMTKVDAERALAPIQAMIAVSVERYGEHVTIGLLASLLVTHLEDMPHGDIRTKVCDTLLTQLQGVRDQSPILRVTR